MMSNTFLVFYSVSFLILVRWLISFHPHSGQGKPPMYGDFEAQRHWMEITYHLPPTEWYKNGSENNLLYWGLDYPPLTAYHSWLCGYISNKINTSWVELSNSRGLEDSSHKLFMRCSVLMADVFIYITSIFYYFLKCDGAQSKEKLYSAFLMLLYPGLLLIDHGHFQYNCISLGLMVWAVNLTSLGCLCSSSVLFVLALNYKQMELYHSTAFFFFILGKIYLDNSTYFQRFISLIKVGLSVIFTFALCWLPFLFSLSDAKNVIGRLFPFNRGLFEDKVANFWCSISVLIKLKQVFDMEILVKMCLICTLISLVPSSLNLVLKPSLKQFKYALVNSSLSFYLFSYQVHEKSILLPAVASILLYSEHKLLVPWFQVISTFSMLPLFIKDDLVMPFLSCSVMFCLLLTFRSTSYKLKENHGLPACIAVGASLFSVVASSFLIFCVRPPRHMPDLFVVLISAIYCVHFLGFFAFFNVCQMLDSKVVTFTHLKKMEKIKSS